jgi:hypothetical protein
MKLFSLGGMMKEVGREKNALYDSVTLPESKLLLLWSTMALTHKRSAQIHSLGGRRTANLRDPTVGVYSDVLVRPLLALVRV